jgi:hypothetical protein
MPTRLTKMRKLADLARHFIINMEYGHSFRYYCGTNAHDDDYIEYDVYKFYYIADDIFYCEWYSSIDGQRHNETLDWEELTDWLDEMWN